MTDQRKKSLRKIWYGEQLYRKTKSAEAKHALASLLTVAESADIVPLSDLRKATKQVQLTRKAKAQMDSHGAEQLRSDPKLDHAAGVAQ
jgi:hypothetical protein